MHFIPPCFPPPSLSLSLYFPFPTLPLMPYFPSSLLPISSPPSLLSSLLPSHHHQQDYERNIKYLCNKHSTVSCNRLQCSKTRNRTWLVALWDYVLLQCSLIQIQLHESTQFAEKQFAINIQQLYILFFHHCTHSSNLHHGPTGKTLNSLAIYHINNASFLIVILWPLVPALNDRPQWWLQQCHHNQEGKTYMFLLSIQSCPSFRSHTVVIFIALDWLAQLTLREHNITSHKCFYDVCSDSIDFLYESSIYFKDTPSTLSKAALKPTVLILHLRAWLD